MEIKLIFKNGRQTYVNVKDLSQSEVEKAINAEEDRFGSVVTKIDQSEVQEHGAGGFIIGAVAGGYLTNLIMKEGVKGASKTVAKGVNRIAKATASAVKKVSSKSAKSKKKSSSPVAGTTTKKSSSKNSGTTKSDVPKAPAKKNIRYISNSLIRSIDVKGGKRIFNKDIIDGAHLNKGINIPANNGYSKKPKNLREDKSLSSQTDYLSARRINSVQTTFGKRIPGSQIKDGAYVKDGVLFENGGIIDTSRFTKEEFFKVVNNWVYFTYNYPHNFVHKVFNNEHFEAKFSRAYERHGSASAVVSFWNELDTENQKTLAIWVKNNYFNYKSEEESLKAISDDVYAEIISIWNRFCYNYPHTFVNNALTSNPKHFESKFTRSYEKYGSRGAVNNFFTELSTDLQRVLTDWVYDYYSANKFAKGGSTDTSVAQTILQQIGGYNRVNAMTGAYNFLASKHGLSFRIKNPKANYIKITLNGKDLYDIEIGKIHGLNYKVVKSYNDVYAEDLIGMLEQGTGMYFRFEDGGMVDSFGEGGSTGQKIFSIKPTSIGKAKYVIDYHDGHSTHKDGSKFIGIDTYSSKEKLQKGIKRFLSEGYRQVNSVFKVLNDGKDYEQGGSIQNPHRHTYMMLSRLQSDCEYFLNHGGRSEKNLWALSVDAQIEEMKNLWNSLPEDGKPEWLTMEQIEEYEKQMKEAPEYSEGGGVGYGDKTLEQVWNNWSVNQRRHFLKDHQVMTNNAQDHRISLYRFEELPADLVIAIKNVLKEHLLDIRYAEGGSVNEEIKVGGQIGFLNPKNGRYMYSDILSIEGEKVNMVERHPTRSSWDNYFTETLERIHKYLKTPSEDFGDGRMLMKYRKPSSNKFAEGGGVNSDKEWKSLHSKVTDFLSKHYPDYTQEKMDSMDDEEFNDKFLEMVDRVREEFPETADDNETASTIVDNYIFNHEFELGGRISEHEGTKYFTYNFENKGNNWEINVVWGKSNYISVLKKTNNPFGGRIGKHYKNLEDALDHYKDMNIKAQIIFAVEEAEKYGYVPEKYADGGLTDGYTLNSLIIFKTSGDDSYLTGNIGGNIIDLINVRRLGVNEYEAIARSYSVAFEGIKSKADLEDAIFNELNEQFTLNSEIDVYLENVEVVTKDITDEKYADGGSTHAPLNSVEVIFEDPKHNYTTSVASSLTEEEARSYFVGKRFNVASFPREQFERVIDIKFTKGDGSQFANGGSTQTKSNKRYFPKSVEGYVFAKPVEEEPNNLIPVEYTGIGIFDSILGMFVALDNDGRMVPYRPAGGYSTAQEIADQMNSGEIAQHAIYTVPDLFYKPARDITLRPLEVDPLYIQLQRHAGSHEQAHNFRNVESHGMFGTDSNGGRGQMIENKELGLRFLMPKKIYEYVDGSNLYISTYGGVKGIRTYPQNYGVAVVTEDGTLDFSWMDKAISLDRSKVKEAFEKGYIPTTSYRLIDRLKNSGITELPDYLKPRA